MNKSDKIKILLRGYFKGKLTAAEREQLYFLIHQEDLEEAVFCEQYKVWNESPDRIKNVSSQEIFQRIRTSADMTDEMLTEGDLRLKGLKYNQLQSHKARIYSFMKYAAVILMTALISGFAYYITGKARTAGLARNEITVPYGSRIRITLADSSEVWLNSGSRLSYPDRFAKRNREVFLEGEAFFDIRKNPRQPFYVKTSDIDIKVLGTRFNVKSYPEEDIIETTLVSGQLMIETQRTDVAGIKKAILNPNQKAYYSKKVRRLKLERKEYMQDQKPVTAITSKLVNIKDMERINQVSIETSWKDNRLIFRDEPLRSLAKKLERWYNVEITIKDSELGDYKFTGSIENETIENAMKALSAAASLDYSIDRKKIEITRKD